MKRPVVLTVAACVALMAIFSGATQGEDEPKYTIKDVMKTAHQGAGSLRAKVLRGQASAEEKEKLVELYTALSQNKPPKGEAAAWKERTTAILEAAKAVAKGEEGALGKLETATNCAACHRAHRPS
jgi:mono/diheme cytochrome c family protein